MSLLLSLSRLIDRITERIGQTLYWLILVTVLISAANAVVRKAFNYSSNSYLEAQWYLFWRSSSSAPEHAAPQRTRAHRRHSGRLSSRARAWIDIFGALFFLLPMAILIGWLGWPVFVDSYVRGEVLSNAGGLIIWPARVLVPVGLPARGAGHFRADQASRIPDGLIPDPMEKHLEKTAEEQLAEDILRARGEESLAAEVRAWTTDEARERGSRRAFARNRQEVDARSFVMRQAVSEADRGTRAVRSNRQEADEKSVRHAPGSQ